MRSGISAAAVLMAALLVSSSASALDWPFVIESGDTVITIYMPQVESLKGDIITGRSAISISVPAMDTPVFGAVWFESYCLTDRESRTVVLSDVKVMGARFPSMEGQNLEVYGKLVTGEIEEWEFLITLDELNAMLEYVDKQNIAVEEIKNDPPRIIFRSTPSVLILIDGEPREQDLENTDLKYVVNTAFFIVYDKKSRTYYMRGGPWWYSSKKVDSGYAPVERVPEEVASLAAEAEKAAAEDAASEAAAAAEAGEDPPPDPAAELESKSPPEIIVSTEPAELIMTEGDPAFAPVEGTELLYMTNTDSDVFMDLKGQNYFTLISGRWYAAPSMDAKWKYVPPDGLPEDFAKIPPDSENGHVLASVAGTEQARDAVLDMYVPQTAEVDRKEATVSVEYDGEPKFEKIEKTDMTYAVNTSSSVIKSGNTYYCCDDAVWFEAASPTGPWAVCVEVPDVIYTIPPSCPVYNVIYVYVYDYSPEVVYVGYTPGYTCSYVYGGTVVYGTGYYYYPWYGAYYYPRPVTWGFRVHYNPYSGWGFSVGIGYGGPYGWMRVGWGYPYHRYWGPAPYRYGYNRGYRHGYHRGYNRGFAAGYRAGQHHSVSNNMYKNRADGVKRTGDVRTGSPSTMQKGGRTSNTYADRNGNVYRNNDGNWEKQGGSRDRAAQQPSTANRNDLNNQKAARDKGSRGTSQNQRDKSTGQRDTRQTTTGQRNTGQKSTTQRDTRQTTTGQRDTRQTTTGQRSTRPTSSGQRNTRSTGSRRTSGGGRRR
jgi:hypothetical protein